MKIWFRKRDGFHVCSGDRRQVTEEQMLKDRRLMLSLQSERLQRETQA